MPHESAVRVLSALGFPGHLFHDPFHAPVGAWLFGGLPSDP